MAAFTRCDYKGSHDSKQTIRTSVAFWEANTRCLKTTEKVSFTDYILSFYYNRESESLIIYLNFSQEKKWTLDGFWIWMFWPDPTYFWSLIKKIKKGEVIQWKLHLRKGYGYDFRGKYIPLLSSVEAGAALTWTPPRWTNTTQRAWRTDLLSQRY